MKKEILDKLNKISSGKSEWQENANFREVNEAWLDKSAEIALRILRALRSKNMTQKDLAEMLNVSAQQINKIVKGKENLTLETISKLERALQIELIAIPTTINPFQGIKSEFIVYYKTLIPSKIFESIKLEPTFQVKAKKNLKNKSTFRYFDVVTSESVYEVEEESPEYKINV